MSINEVQPRIEGNFAKMTEIVSPLPRGNGFMASDFITSLPKNEWFIKHLVLKSKFDEEQFEQVSDLLMSVDLVLKGNNETTMSDLRKALITQTQKLQEDLKTDPEPVRFLLKLFIDSPDRMRLSSLLDNNSK